MVNFKKSTKGITLVALIITVIVLVVLAVFSIRLAIRAGIIQKADETNQEFILRGEREAIYLAYQDYLQRKEWEEEPVLVYVEGTAEYAQDPKQRSSRK